ncbi:choline-sulfatase [Methylobacterium sp. E-066]|uniref:choline-sulfatase n=1 Tax=Methylobacterium sp. E-066 TaxID=2836584 RepID=UPI001FBB955A|nr:choline-sulfatase [Methylobacterium sp. E-066]MCJ2142411.1 choline-sulfatase [Methylobacterium sp. E-066]
MGNSRKPNVLVFMADQMNPLFLPFYGHPVTRAPQMAKAAAEGVVFESAYCNFPLCAPSRYVFMSGRLPSRIGAYDNAAEFQAEIPTFAHALRNGGYRTILSGKMHFCGADQMHGFEERLTTDIYPSDFNWTPDWDAPTERQEWFHTMSSVLDAGPCVRTNQLDFDDEVVFAAERKIYAMVRDKDERPFFMVVSMTHPHDPFAIPAEYWDRYTDEEIDLPRHTMPFDAADPHSQRIRTMCKTEATPPSLDQIRAARRAYYGAISYVDDQFGRLRRALEATNLADDTIIVIVSDHGEMLGERGLWFKMTFFEGAIRIPLVVHAPSRFAPARVAESVSLMDLLPTFLDITGTPPLPTPLEGRSLLPHLQSRPSHDEAFAEYLAEGAVGPIVMIRRGAYKFIHSLTEPDLLFDLFADPEELSNLAEDPSAGAVLSRMRREAAERWALPALKEEILQSQRRRRFVYSALATGARTPWDYQPVSDASRQYVRNHMNLDDVEAMARFPRP